MPKTMPLRALAALAAVSGALAIAPAAHAADSPTFCVNAPSCPAGGFKVSLTAALSMSGAGPGPADILIGPAPDGKPYVGPFTYSPGSAPDNFVDIKGEGSPKLTSATAGKPVLDVPGPSNSSVTGLDIHVPALSGADGLRLGAGGAGGIRVTGGVDGGGNHGLVVKSGSLTDISIDMLGTGLSVDDGQAILQHAVIKAQRGIVAANADVRLDRTRVAAVRLGVDQTGSHGGGVLIEDGLTLHSSTVTTSAPDAEAITAIDSPVTLIRASLAGRSAAPQAGHAGLAAAAVNRDVAISVFGTVVGGYPQSLRRTASGGHVAPLTVQDSEWSRAGDFDGGDAAGSRKITNLVDKAPRYVDRAANDLRLRGGDPAIDLMTFAGSFGSEDLDQRSAIDGDADGKLRTDAGAHEYRRLSPNVVAFDATPPHFTAKATDPDGDHVELTWDFGDGATAKGAAVDHTYAPGTYEGTLSARDDAGIVIDRKFSVTVPADPAPASGDGTPSPSSGGPGAEPAPVPAGTPGDGTVAPSGGTVPALDRAAPSIVSAKLARRRGARRAKLTIVLSEAAKLRITAGGRTRTLTVPAGRVVRKLKLARRTRRIRIVAIDAAGNRSAVRKVRLRRS